MANMRALKPFSTTVTDIRQSFKSATQDVPTNVLQGIRNTQKTEDGIIRRFARHGLGQYQVMKS